MPTPLPSFSSIAVYPSSHGAVRTGLGSIRNYLAELFGTDGVTTTALETLGVDKGRYAAIAANYTAVPSDRGLFIAATDTWTLTLPVISAVPSGWGINIVNIGSGTITVDPPDSATIDGLPSIAVLPGLTAFIVFTGAVWLSSQSTVALATTAANGLLSAPDKVKLDGLGTFADNTFFIQDGADPSKLAKFVADSISPSTTRFFTLPDGSGTLAVLSLGQTFTNNNVFTGNLHNVTSATVFLGSSAAASTVSVAVGATASGLTKTLNLGTAGLSGSTSNIAIGSAFAGALGTLTINSPTVAFGANVTAINLPDAATFITDNADPAKKLKFEVSAIASGTTRTLTAPDASGTIALDTLFTSGAKGLVPASGGGTTTFLRADGTFAAPPGGGGGGVTDGDKGDVVVSGGGTVWSLDYTAVNAVIAPNWANFAGTPVVAISDSNLTIRDNADATKQLRFEAGGITTGTTRTLTAPDASGTLALDATFTSGAKGLVPASGGGTTNFLRADGTFAAPPGGGGGVSDGDKGDVVVSGGGTVWSLDYTAVNAVIAPNWANFAGTPVLVIADSNLTLRDGVDATKQAQFVLDSIATGTTHFYTLPNGSGTLPVLSLPQTFTNNNTFSGSFHTVQSATVVMGSSAAATTVSVASGATTTGVTKAVNIGTAGLSGSTTNIAIGSAVAGALGTLTFNSPTVAFGATVTAINLPDVATFVVDSADPTKRLQIDAGSITTGTTRTLTAPDASGTIALDTLFTSGAKGLVPASGGGTTTFLRADGTFAAPAGGGSSAWGGITGTLADQTDLQTALDGKQPLATKLTDFVAAAEVEIEGGQLRLDVPGSAPAAPAAGGIKLTAKTLAGRSVPAFVSQDGLVREMQPGFSRGAQAVWKAQAAVNTLNVLGPLPTPAITGTATLSVVTTTNLYTLTPRLEYLVTVASATAVVGFRGAVLASVGGPSADRGGFEFVGKWGPATGVATATNRAAFGLLNSTAASTDVEPSTTQVNCIFMGWDAADTNIQMMFNDATGACTKVDLGASFPVPSTDRSALYELALSSPKGTTQSVTWTVTDLVSGDIASGTQTTDLPSTTTLLTPKGWMSVGGTSSAIGMGLSSIYFDPLL